MISEEDLLFEIKKAAKECRTTLCVIVDTKVCKNVEKKDTDKFILKENVAWNEPYKGVYVFNTFYINHFKNYNTIKELHQNLVDCGYKVNSKRFEKNIPSNFLKIKPNNQNTIAMVILISKKGILPHLKKFLKNVNLPKDVNVDVILGNNSGKLLSKRNLPQSIKQKYNNIFFVDLGKPYEPRENEHYLEISKHSHIAILYSKVLREIVNSYTFVLKIEDDIEPPIDGVVRLYNHFKNLESSGAKVAAVAGHYPQKLDPETICVSMQPEIWGNIPKINEVPPRLFEVEMQGGGFTLYSSNALKEILPYKLTFKQPNGGYYMTGWDGTAGEAWNKNGWKQYCDGKLYCNHYF